MSGRGKGGKGLGLVRDLVCSGAGFGNFFVLASLWITERNHISRYHPKEKDNKIGIERQKGRMTLQSKTRGA